MNGFMSQAFADRAADFAPDVLQEAVVAGLIKESLQPVKVDIPIFVDRARCAREVDSPRHLVSSLSGDVPL